MYGERLCIGSSELVARGRSLDDDIGNIPEAIEIYGSCASARNFTEFDRRIERTCLFAIFDAVHPGRNRSRRPVYLPVGGICPIGVLRARP